MHRTNHTILQNLQIFERKTTVSKVECNICGKGLDDGHSISAKTLSYGTVLFCDVHYKLD
ncbi:MAG: hypothetical protein MAG458_01313 [Nitrosopumilus sp.]|nr:hypothetical protein [Nitrosopumilus sp.]